MCGGEEREREDGGGEGWVKVYSTTRACTIPDHQVSMLCTLITQEPCAFNITHPHSQFNLYTGSMSVLGVEISICSIRVSLRKRTRW